MSTVPVTVDGAAVLCTQYVSPATTSTFWCTSACPLMGALAVGLSQSLPTANTQFPAAMFGSEMSQAPREALACPTLPVPEALVKPTTVSEPCQLALAAGCELIVAVKGAFGAVADQISDVPHCLL